jgi:integrase
MTVRPNRLNINEIVELPKAKQFLNSKARGSKQTEQSYSVALSHLQKFLTENNYQYTVESIIDAFIKGKINVYTVFDGFVGYMVNNNLSYRTISLYVAGVKSYLEYYDVEISTKKFKNKVTLPSKEKKLKEAIDANDIRNILQACTSDRLRSFLLVLASSGMRSGEALCLRNCDIDFSSSPTRIHILAKNTKTKSERYAYISNEASNHLKSFILGRYLDENEMKKYPNHIVFAQQIRRTEICNCKELYIRMQERFTETLHKVGLDQKVDGQNRRKITLHLLRAFVKSVVSVQTNSDFSEWLLGHSGSTYFSIKEKEKAELYRKCEPYLTFLDYATVESVGQDFESKLQERDSEMIAIRQEMDRLNHVISAMQKNPKLAKIKPEVLKKKVKV